jgi:hypothetical protein
MLQPLTLPLICTDWDLGEVEFEPSWVYCWRNPNRRHGSQWLRCNALQREAWGRITVRSYWSSERSLILTAQV